MDRKDKIKTIKELKESIKNIKKAIKKLKGFIFVHLVQKEIDHLELGINKIKNKIKDLKNE
jgi:predicted metalloenzyme YecM